MTVDHRRRQVEEVQVSRDKVQEELQELNEHLKAQLASEKDQCVQLNAKVSKCMTLCVLYQCVPCVQYQHVPCVLYQRVSCVLYQRVSCVLYQRVSCVLYQRVL